LGLCYKQAAHITNSPKQGTKKKATMPEHGGQIGRIEVGYPAFSFILAKFDAM
jgi:hypothetical protein